jgi:hypothetical protein
VSNCATGTAIGGFHALHKYELGGIAQVVPATNPAALSSHVGIWSHTKDNNYQLTFKMFRFDSAGNNIGWVIVKNDVAIGGDNYAGTGVAETFDINGNSLGKSCPTFVGKRFE